MFPFNLFNPIYRNRGPAGIYLQIDEACKRCWFPRLLFQWRMQCDHHGFGNCSWSYWWDTKGTWELRQMQNNVSVLGDLWHLRALEQDGATLTETHFSSSAKWKKEKPIESPLIRRSRVHLSNQTSRKWWTLSLVGTTTEVSVLEPCTVVNIQKMLVWLFVVAELSNYCEMS